MDAIIFGIFRFTASVINLLPVFLRVSLVGWGLKLVALVKPKFTKIAERNLELAFPSDREKHQKVLQALPFSLARLVVDTLRIPVVTEEWVHSHIQFPDKVKYLELREKGRGVGILYATGHLGSFELLGFSLAYLTKPIRFIARPFKIESLNAWWTGVRESSGNKSIARNGAFREVIRGLREGDDVAILFDQNLTRNNAFFVPWFGRPAATTKALAYAAIATRAPVAAISLIYLGGENYRIDFRPCDVQHLYDDTSLKKDDKAVAITEIVSREFEAMIRQHPEGWFWMHRRWKTTEDGIEMFYKDI